MARGQLIHEEVLVQALKEKWIAGAALDVFENEPLPLSDPLLELDNVILTPHWLSEHPSGGARDLGCDRRAMCYGCVAVKSRAMCLNPGSAGAAGVPRCWPRFVLNAQSTNSSVD